MKTPYRSCSDTGCAVQRDDWPITRLGKNRLICGMSMTIAKSPRRSRSTIVDKSTQDEVLCTLERLPPCAKVHQAGGLRGGVTRYLLWGA